MAARQTGQSSKNKSGSGEIGFSIGGNLSIISEQDTDDYASKQTQAGGTFVYGSGGTVNIGQQKVESHLRSVQEQSGIVAGNGGFDITVAGNTHLEGGVIGSTADASKNRLDTGSLTVVDIENESRAKTSGGGIGTGMSSGGGISNPLGSAAGAGLSLLGGTKKNDSSTTRSDIAAGTVVVRDGNESALAGLDRTATGFDTDSALSAVDLRKMQERAEVMQLGGQLLFKGVGDLGGYLSQKAETEEGKAFWADGGNGRALLHGMAGAAMAALGGADALNGAVSAAGAEKAKIAISEFLESNKGSLSWEDYQSLMEVGSAMVGGALGGSTGANIAVTGDRFNRQLHPDEVKWIRFHAEEFAREQKISKEEAYRILLVEAAAYVDSKIQSDLSGVENNTDAIDFLRKNQNKYDWGTAFDSSDRDNFSKFSEELGRETGYFKDVYTAISGTAYAAGSTKDWRFEFQEPLRYYGDASRSQKGVAVVQAGAAALGIGAAAAVEFGGWCILNPYSCTKAISGAADAVMGDYVGGHSLAPVLPALVAAKAATTAEQTLRLSSGAVGAEIAGNAAKKGGLQSEQVLKPMQAAGADVAEAGAKAGASEQSSLATLNRLSPQEEAELLKRQLIQAERHDPWIGTTLPGAEAPVTVTAEATVGGRMLKDTNQTARPTKLADADHPTLVADLLPHGAPNSSMKSAHAEIAVIQRAYEQGLTAGERMVIVVRGEPICSFCRGSDNLLAAAERSGLERLEVIGVEGNSKLIWTKGSKGFREVVLHE